MMWRVAGVVLVLAPLLFSGGVAAQDDRRVPLQPLLGAWKGSSHGQPGKGTVRREYRSGLRQRARETYRLDGDALVEVFELAESGKDFSVYSEAHRRRAAGR